MKQKSNKSNSHVIHGIIIALLLVQVLFLVNLYTKVGSLSAQVESFSDQVEAVAVVGRALDGEAGGPAPAAPTARKFDVSADDDPVKGDPDAPVTIIEFSDFECPFCARWYSQTLPQIQSEYIDKGLVKVVYRDFPLNFHPNAQKAAEAAECADDQGKFWEMHDMIFENQRDLSLSTLKAFAGQLDLDRDVFDSCLDSGKYTAEVQKDMSDGQAAGITGTPGFFVNGQKIVGAQPFAAFKAVIDAELAELE